jgi:multidrug efflux pump subunit AcrA (membrane-fusion protein)
MHANNEREGSHAEAQIAQAKLEQAAAEATLIKSQIEKATIRAEIDGTVLEGDLRDMKGAAVEQGKALFVIGDPKNLRVEISVPERDIQELLARQREAAEKGEAFKGYIATETFPDRWSEVKVTRIVPMGRPKEGENMFTVYAEVDPSHMQGTWSPGVQGLAKLEIERRRVIWIWTHRVVDYVRLNFWL